MKLSEIVRISFILTSDRKFDLNSVWDDFKTRDQHLSF